MTTPKIWKASEISVENFIFSKKNKSVSVEYSPKIGDKVPLYLLSPKLEYSLPVKWEKLRLSVYLQESNKSQGGKITGKQFGSLFKQLDEYLPVLAHKNRKEWFDESLWDSDISAFQENYRRQIAFDKEKGLECIRFNLIDPEGMIYNENNQLIDTNTDPLQELAFSKHYISILLKCRGIWIVEEAYGLSWDIIQMKLYEPKNTLPIGCHPLEYDAIKSHQPSEIKIQAKPNLSGIDMTPMGISEPDPLQNEPIINYLMKDD